MRPWYVYVLRDPRAFCDVRYVGWTICPAARLAKHRKNDERPDTRRARWVASIQREGVQPVMDVVESGDDGDGWRHAERKWIALLRGEGCRLTNHTDGGDGVRGLKHRPDSLAKMAAAKRGRTLTAEHRRKIGEAGKGRKISRDMIERMAEGRRRAGISDEARARLVEQARVNFQRPDVWEKRSLTRKRNGKTLGPEARASIARKNAGRKPSPEAIRRSIESRRRKADARRVA